MSRHYFAFIILTVAVWSAAQDQPNSSQVTNGAVPVVEDDQRAPAPALLGGDTNSLAFSSELERSNYLRGGITVGATYDDNASNTAVNQIGDLSYSLLPSIELDQTRSRLHWTLAYFGGFTANQRLTTRNQGSHNLSGSLQYRLSPHVDLRLSDSFLDTTGFLQQFQNGLGTPVTGPINQPNPTLITPLAKNLANTGTANLSYQFSADDSLGVGGTFYDSHFRDQPASSATLMDTSTRSGNAFLNHRFSPRNWTTVTYQFERFESEPAADRTVTHSFLLSHTIYLQPRMTLSFFVGPEYTQLDTVTVTMNVAPPVISFATVSNAEHHLSVSGGGGFGWQGEHTSVRLDVSRKVSDGGGLLKAVQLTSVGGGIRQQVAKSTALHISALYGHNRELGNTATSALLNSASAGAGVEQRLPVNFMLRLDYNRDYQKGNSVSPLGSVNHNRGSISISYNFTRPLGR